jgi:hypothetical protein
LIGGKQQRHQRNAGDQWQNEFQGRPHFYPSRLIEIESGGNQSRAGLEGLQSALGEDRPQAGSASF